MIDGNFAHSLRLDWTGRSEISYKITCLFEKWKKNRTEIKNIFKNEKRGCKESSKFISLVPCFCSFQKVNRQLFNGFSNCCAVFFTYWLTIKYIYSFFFLHFVLFNLYLWYSKFNLNLSYLIIFNVKLMYE